MIRLPKAALVALFLALPLAASSAEKPNIILIVADDLGYGDLSSYGAKDIATPNLDRMAAEGARLTSFYAAPLCTPSRAQILTGRYPVRSGLVRVLYPTSKTGIDDAEVTVAEQLRKAGYSTAAIGKWHLGHLPEFRPQRHGFDSWLGIPYSNDMKPTPLMRNDEQVEEPARQDTLTRRYTEEAIRIMRTARRPFFIYLAHTMPHFPLAAGEEFRGKSQRGLYGDVIQELDWSTGEILRTLKELKLDSNTLVIFTSDNGPWLEQGSNAGSAGPLRAGKETVFEGGIRVPFIARWPGRIPAGRVTPDPAMDVDFLSTFSKLAGTAPPAKVTLDGRDMMPVMTGKGSRGSEEFFFYLDGELCGMRSGNWKLHLPCKEKKRPDVPHSLALFDLGADLAESKDLAATETAVVQRLQKRAQEFDAQARKDARPEKW